MKNSTRPRQPTVTSRTQIEPPHFVIQELPDPEGHLTEEQKKWPISGYVSVPISEVPLSKTAQSGEPNQNL